MKKREKFPNIFILNEFRMISQNKSTEIEIENISN
jgi:hypothetical protein